MICVLTQQVLNLVCLESPGFLLNADSYLVDLKGKEADEFSRAPSEGTIASQSVKPTDFSV